MASHRWARNMPCSLCLILPVLLHVCGINFWFLGFRTLRFRQWVRRQHHAQKVWFKLLWWTVNETWWIAGVAQKPVGRLPQQMRLACLELRQVLMENRVFRQVNQFYLAPVRRTKVPARLFHQICWNACVWQDWLVCYATIALIWVTANCMLQCLSTLKSPSVVSCSLTAALLSRQVWFSAPLQLCDSLKSWPPSSPRSFRTQSYLTLHCRISSSTFIISDVQSVYTPSQIQDQ